MISHIWNLKKKKKKKELNSQRQRTDGYLPEREMSEGGQKVKTSRFKISSGDIRYSMVTIVNNTELHI